MVRSTLVLAAVLSVASISLAGDLVTPPAFVGGSTNVECNLVNTESAPIPAHLELISRDGTVLQDSGSITVNGGAATSITQLGPDGYVYCRFANASKKARAGLATWLNTDDTSDHLFVPAQ
jgi:hypothetical protein